MTLAGLALLLLLAQTAGSQLRWQLIWEFLEEYRYEPGVLQPPLLQDEPFATGNERWDALLVALADHLAAQHELAPAEWADLRVLRRPWFPAELAVRWQLSASTARPYCSMTSRSASRAHSRPPQARPAGMIAGPARPRDASE